MTDLLLYSFYISLSLTLLGWLAGFLMLWHVPVIRSPFSQGNADLVPCRLSIIIPAYNEARRISPLLQSIQLQTYRPFELLVVDDHSTDNTAGLAKSYGASVIQSDPIRPGWIGKARACWSGAKAAQGDTLLFLDADTVLDQPDSLSCLLRAYQSSQTGLFSVQPFHRTLRAYESFSALFNIIVLAGLNRFTLWGQKLSRGGAFGPCIVCPREVYLKTGGHEAIRHAVMDDLALGHLFEQHHYPVHCTSGKGVVSFRMYPEGIRSLMEGWSKSFATASGETHPVVMLLIIFYITAGFSSMAGLLTALIAGNRYLILSALLSVVLMQGQMLWLTQLAGRFQRLMIWLYPVQFIFFALLFLWSAYMTHVKRTVSWRGRKIDV